MTTETFQVTHYPACNDKCVGDSHLTHDPCRESCACWKRGAMDEANARKPRPGIRQLTDYIRAASDNDPTLDDKGMARLVFRVFTSDNPLREAARAALDAKP